MVKKDKKRARGRPKEFEPSDALDKAVEVFWELGYEAADTATLCTKMKISKPSLYNSFGSKEDLFLKAIQRYGETFSEKHLKALLEGSSPEEGMRAFFSVIAHDVSGKDYPSGCMIACVAIPASVKLVKLAILVRESMERRQRHMTKYFESQIEEGALPSKFDVFAAVSLIQDLMLALAFQARMGASLESLKKRGARNAELTMLAGLRKLSP